VPSGEPEVAYEPFTLGALDLGGEVWPVGLALHEGSLFVADLQGPALLRLDPSSGAITERLPVDGFFPAGLASAGDRLYFTDLHTDRIERLHPAEGRKEWPLPYYQTWPWAVAASDEHLFVLDSRYKKVVVIDPVDGSEIRSFAAPGKRPSALAWDSGWLWSADVERRELFRIDPKTGWVVHRVPSPAIYPSGIAVDGDALLVSDLQAGKVFRVRPYAEAPWIEDQSERYRVDFRMDLAAVGTGEIADIRTSLAIPETRPGQRLLGDLRFDPEPVAIETEPSGQRFAVFHLDALPAGERTQVKMSVDVEVSRAMFQIDPDQVVAPPDPLPSDLALSLEDGRKYQLDSETIAERTKAALGDEARPYFRTRAIYEALADSIEYDRSGGWGAAPTVLERGTGSCSEYTFALVAMLRSAGIPTRYVGALVKRGPDAGVDFVYHRWAEVWFGEPWGWVPVDANHGASEKPEVRSDAFGSLKGRYLVTTVSYGESEHLDWSYNYDVRYDVVGEARLESETLAVWTPLAPE
jgi:transglutaminase-like putative cysteine protease